MLFLPVIALTDALQVADGRWPPYASMVLLELYEASSSASGFAIRIIYNGNVLKLPYCSNQTMSDYDEFSSYMATITPTNVAKQCASKKKIVFVHTCMQDDILCIVKYCTVMKYICLVIFKFFFMLIAVNCSRFLFRIGVLKLYSSVLPWLTSVMKCSTQKLVQSYMYMYACLNKPIHKMYSLSFVVNRDKQIW